ncbi:hypothetical protein CF327_g2661 [Tilletia walkeri]|nr:hypothetical protein CF327_g2661 [Tilletia walkeri]
MSGHQPRPLPPMPTPGPLRPGGPQAHEEAEVQHQHYQQQQQQQQYQPWTAQHLPSSDSTQWSYHNQQPTHAPNAPPHSWSAANQYPNPYQAQPYPSSGGATAAQPLPYSHNEAARPDPLALMTFQSGSVDSATTPTANSHPMASLPEQRPPLPFPPTAAHGRTQSFASPSNRIPVQMGNHGGSTDNASLSLNNLHARMSLPGGGFGGAPHVPTGWSVQPSYQVPLPHANGAPRDHGPLPQLPTSVTSSAVVASPTVAELPSFASATSSPHSRPGSGYVNSATSSPRPSHSDSGSGPVHTLAQQLAANSLHHHNANGSGGRYNSNDLEIMPYGHQEIIEEPDQIQYGPTPPRHDNAIQEHHRRSHSPSFRSGSSADYFTMSASPSSGSIVSNTTGMSHSPSAKFVPQGWTVVPSGSNQVDGSLAPPRASTSFSTSSKGTSDDATSATDDDDRRSILSLGSRRAAFSRDLADPNFLANMGIIARDVPLSDHAKGSLVYPGSFTGKALISTLQEVIPAELFVSSQEPTSEEQQMYYARLAAMQVADALREQNLFHEVEWEQGDIIDSEDALYAFSDDTFVRFGAAVRRPSSFFGAAQTGEPGPANEDSGEQGDHGEGGSRDVHTARRRHGNPQRSKTLPWQDTVTPELRSKLGKYEVKRQNTILEAIEHEQQFLADLELLQDLFVDGLKAKNVIAADEYDNFVKVVFGNHRQLASHIRSLVEELHVRQAEQFPIVRSVGDLFLNAALTWREEYCSAIANYPFAANRVQKEDHKNPAFRTFLKECLRDPRAQRHELTTFLYRPVVRLQRYQLYFKSIMEAIQKSREATSTTGRLDEESAEEYETLNTVNQIIHAQVEDAQRDLVTSQYKVDIANFAEAFAATTKRSEFEVDMDLGNPERQLKHRGKVLLDGVEMIAILFDNYFVLAKELKTPGEQTPGAQRLVLAKRPIPVELLETSGFNGQPVSTSLAIFRHLSSRKVSRQVWAFTISHSHGRSEPFTLTVSEESTRREWKSKFEDTCTMRRIVQENVKAWTVSTLNDDVFAVFNSTSSAADAARDPGMKGTVNCTSLFNVLLEGQRRPCIAVGTEQGVFIGPQHSSAIQKVLSLHNVTQMAVMDQLDLMFVLAGNVLWVCRLVDLFVRPQNLTGFGSSPTLQQVSGREDEVLFFSLGMLDSMRVVVYAKKKAYDRGTGFVILETHFDPGWAMRIPFAMRGVNGGPQFKPFGNGRFEIATDVYSLQFRRKGLSLCTARGFELCNIGRNESCAFLPVPAPAAKDDAKAQALQKRIKTAKPMALFKIADNEFLLCYNTFGCFVTPDRGIARDGAVIEWETEPIAFIYRSPYLLAVDPSFVEIRIFNNVTRSATNEPVKALSGRLLQFFRAEQMRLLNTQANDSVDLMPTFDSQRPVQNGLAAGPDQRDPALDSIILGAVKRPKSGARGARTFQAIVEVVPLQYANTTPAVRQQWP